LSGLQLSDTKAHTATSGNQSFDTCHSELKIGSHRKKCKHFRQHADSRLVATLQIVNPWHRPDASMSFSRLFSNWAYSAILDGTEFSNVHVFRIGASATPTESVELTLDLFYYLADETFDAPVHFDLGHTPAMYSHRVPWLAGFSFWTDENDDDLGWELSLGATYQYSEDLYFAVGWSHLFVEDGLEEGSFNNLNGHDFSGGIGDEDADYFAVETGITF